MTLPDLRRLLQVVLAVAAPRQQYAYAINLSKWRQDRNLLARACHAETRRRKLREQRQRLRDTG